ncbi:MAG: SDR family NAD(P)-dependent oxidoreductase [Thermodesulfobacteriota bacterium]
MRLKNRVAIVTGGGHGIGRAYCLGLAKEEAKVVVADIDFPAAEETRKLAEQGGGSALAIQVDVANEQSTLTMAEKTVKAYGKIDILINNAAIFATIPISRLSFDKVSIEEWDRLMNVNLKGMWLCCRAVVPYMKEQKSGKIINISSSSIFAGRGMRIHYTTSKAGVLGFTRTLARELGDYGITVNSLTPGSTLSESKEDAAALAMRQKSSERRCLKKVQVPEDLVGPMIFLCSSDSDFMTGQTMNIDGGDAMI